METFFPDFTVATLIAALFVGVGAGFVKGVVGFAMPLVLISGLTVFISPQVALAGLIVPTVVTNLFQSLRQGTGAAWQAVRDFRYFLMAGGVTLVLAAQVVPLISERAFQLGIGVPVVIFALIQLLGWRPRLARKSKVIETMVGAFTGVCGGIAGVWGAPTVLYLTALNTPKQDQMRIQGVIYGAGAVMLLGAHVGSGVLRAETLPFSVALVPPALLGMWLGTRVMDRIDQEMFRKATLIVLVVAGANLIRRALL